VADARVPILAWQVLAELEKTRSRLGAELEKASKGAVAACVERVAAVNAAHAANVRKGKKAASGKLQLLAQQLADEGLLSDDDE
jgi:uncharacterized protein YicC (UPF0701 family)